MASYIKKWRNAWRQDIIGRAKWGERAMLHFLIVETGKALNVPNDVAANLWVKATSSLSLYQVRDKVNTWNTQVREDTRMSKRVPKKGQPAFGLKYVVELALLLQVNDSQVTREGRVKQLEISDSDECVEWHAI